MMSPAVEAHGPASVVTDGSGSNGLMNHLFFIKSKQNRAKNGPSGTPYIINWERLQNHIPNRNILVPSFSITLNHSSADGDKAMKFKYF